MKNKWVSFFSRVAFLCNLCFLMGIVIKFTHDFISVQAIKGTIVILAFFSLLINVVLQVCLLVLRAGKKDIPVKAWLRIFNALIFAVQLIYYFFVPGN